MDKKRVLVPVDGSPQSMAAVRYASRSLDRNSAVLLFHLRPQRPEPYLDFGADFAPADLPFEEWREMAGQTIDRFLDEAGQTFRSGGFARDDVKILSQNVKQGYARDILQKSREDFDLLVLGRFGFAALGGGILGGVAAKLVESAAHVPLSVVGGEPDPGQILIAFDGSPASKRAVECVGGLVRKENCCVQLVTVVRPLNIPHLVPQQFFKARFEADWVDAGTRKMVPLLAEMRKRLIDRGFDGDRVAESILREKTSRAEGLVSEARGRNAGAIVAGRKGLTSSPEFLLGRVTRKILALCEDRAVWII